MRGSVCCMWVYACGFGCVRTCVCLRISVMQCHCTPAYLCVYICAQNSVCEKHDSTPTKKCFHLLHQSHTRLCCVTGTLWSLRSPDMIQEQISADTNILPVWEEGGEQCSRGSSRWGGRWEGWIRSLWENRREVVRIYQLWRPNTVGKGRCLTFLERIEVYLCSASLCSLSLSSCWRSWSSLRLLCSLNTQSALASLIRQSFTISIK